MRTVGQEIVKCAALTLIVSTFLYSAPSFAALVDPSKWANVNLETMVKNFSESIPSLMQFVTALAYVMGMYFIVEGILKLKKYGETRTSGSEASLKSPLIFLGVGGALLYLPTSVQVGFTTFWLDPTPYAYVTDTTDAWTQLIQSIFMIVQLIGTIAFIRGLIILSHIGGQSSQPGSFGKAMAHIVGGILCINIYQFIQAVTNTLALGQI